MKHRQWIVAALIAALAAGLGGCAAAFRDKPLIGEPPQALRAVPAVRPAYPNVGDTPPPAFKPMTNEERAKAEAELADRRAKAAQERRQQIQQPAQ